MVYVILSLSLVNFLLGIFVFRRTQRSSESFAFLLFALSISFWIFCNFLLRVLQELFFLRLSYAMGIVVATTALLWSFFFLKKNIPVFFKFFVVPFSIFVFVLTVSTDTIVKGLYSISTWGYSGQIGQFFWVHSLYFSLLVTILVGTLFFTYYDKKTKLPKPQILIVFLGLLITSAISLWVSFILPFFFQILEYTAIDNFATSFFLLAIAYAILKYQLFNIKLILVEIAIFLLNLFLFLNIFTSHTTLDYVLNIAVFIAVFLFSIFLIHGIYKEIQDREKIESLVWDKARANDRLRMMETQKTEFVSIASHQLRTPITIIKGYASMILEGTFGPIPDRAKDAMNKLYTSSVKVVTLVDDLLTVSRIEQGRVVINLEKTDFKNFILEELEEMKSFAADSKIKLSFKADDDKDYFVDIDIKKFKKAVRHILDNAIKYTSVGGSVYIFIMKDSISGKIRLIVSDTGVGMTPSQIQDLLLGSKNINMLEEKEDDKESFKNKKKNTTGFGLYIAKEIIDAHRGSFSVKSEGLNSGTTVVVELPKAR